MFICKCLKIDKIFYKNYDLLPLFCEKEKKEFEKIRINFLILILGKKIIAYFNLQLSL